MDARAVVALASLCLMLNTFQTAEGSKFWRLTGTTLDLTTLPGEGGIHVVDAVYQRLLSTCAFGADRAYLNNTAYQRTRYGVNYSPGSGGIWQVTQDQLSTINMECSTTLRSGCLEARSQFGVDLSITTMADLDKPLISGMVMAFFMTSQSRINEAGIGKQLAFSSDNLNLEGEDFFELSAELRLCPAAQLDLTFIIDGSGSVREQNFGLITNFLREMISDLDIQPDNVHVSVILLATNATVVMSMEDFRDDTNLEAAFQRIRYAGGLTNTAKAIDLAVSVARNTSSLKRVNKASNVFVLVGDLRSQNVSDAISSAMRAKEMGFELFVLGVGNAEVGQLKAFASTPTCKHLSILDSYFELYLSINQLQKRLCEAPAVVNLISKDSAMFDFNTLPADENSTKLQILKLNVPKTEPSEKYIGSKHIAIKVETMCGHLNMYASYDIAKPGRGFHTYSAVATDFVPGALYVNSSFDGRPLYIAIEALNANESCVYAHYNISIVNEIAVPNPCKNRGQLYFPHPRKDMFIQCDLWGEAFEMTCPPYTVWDQMALTCVTTYSTQTIPQSKPSNIFQRFSSHSTEPANMKSSATSRYNASRASDEATTEYTRTTTSNVPPTTTTKEFVNPCTPSALANNRYFHPHPDPQNYVQCDQSGRAHILSCPPGTVWIQSQLTCNFMILSK